MTILDIPDADRLHFVQIKFHTISATLATQTIHSIFAVINCKCDIKRGWEGLSLTSLRIHMTSSVLNSVWGCSLSYVASGSSLKFARENLTSNHKHMQGVHAGNMKRAMKIYKLTYCSTSVD